MDLVSLNAVLCSIKLQERDIFCWTRKGGKQGDGRTEDFSATVFHNG